MRALRVAAALLLAAGSVVTLAGTSRADAQVDGSWWSEFNTGVPVALPVAVPTLALSSDLTVQELPNGPAAVAAIRLPVPAGTVPATLTIHLVTPATGVSLAGCATTDTWASANGGPWAIRPTCTGTVVPVVLSADGTSGTLDVSAVDQARIELSGIVEVLIAPAAGTTAFSVTLSPPATTDLTGRTFPAATDAPAPVASGAPLPSPDAPSTATTGPAATGAPVPSQKPVVAAPRSSLPLELPAVVAVPPAPSAALPPAVPVSSAVAAAPEPVVASGPTTGVPVVASHVADAQSLVTHTNRRLPALLLLLLALVSVAAFPLRTRAPVLLTSRGAAAAELPVDQAGLGRHRKPRTGRPPRL